MPRATWPAAKARSSTTSPGSGLPGTRGRFGRASGRAATARRRRGSAATASSGVTLLREDGTATYHLASVVDDVDFGITHVVRGNDHRPNEAVHRRLQRRSATTPPEYIHHGLVLGEDGKKLSKRAHGATVASLRDAGIPAEAVRAYLEELGVPAHDVHLDLGRVRRALDRGDRRRSPTRSWPRVSACPSALAPALRGARDLREARDYADSILVPEPAHSDRRGSADARTLPRASPAGHGALDGRAQGRSSASSRPSAAT